MADILGGILTSLPEGKVHKVVIGRQWTAAVVDIQGEQYCGLAAAWRLAEDDGREPPPVAGREIRLVASGLREARGLEASLAAATINAALPRAPGMWQDAKVEEVIRRHGAGRSVVMVGHFPFVEAVRPDVGDLRVLEEHPRPGDLPAEAAAEVLPGADVVVITGMAFMNRTLDGLLRLCSPRAHVILAGPSTPLSPTLFRHGVHELCGAVVTDIEAVLRAVSRDDSLHAMRQGGVRLVTLSANRSS